MQVLVTCDNRGLELNQVQIPASRRRAYLDSCLLIDRNGDGYGYRVYVAVASLVL